MDMAAEWYRDFFQGVVVDFWRLATSAEQTAAEVEFLVRELDIDAGARVLDVPCGDGRHARGLVARGVSVTGVDISEDFLAAARREDPEEKVEWLCDDMRQLPAGADFDGAYCFGNSFGYLDYSGTCEFLVALSGCLRPGARFALDTGMAAESLLPNLEAELTTEVGDVRCSVHNHYRAVASRLDTDYVFVRDGQTETRSGSAHVFTVAGIRWLLEQVGFLVHECHGGLDREPFEFGCRRLLVIAEKVAPD